MTEPSVAAVVAAAGRGERLGGDVPKAYAALAGQPLVAHAVAALTTAPVVDLVVVAAPPDWVSRTEALLVGHHGSAELRVVEGGANRHESVAGALEVLPESVEVVLVHDAARPLVPPSLVEAVVAAVRDTFGAVVPGVPVTDTIRQVFEGLAVDTLDRSVLRAVQTPQGFRRELLDRAYAQGGDLGSVTDDASLVEAMDLAVGVIEGHPEAFKVTTPLDLVLAEAVLATRGGAL